MNSVQKSTFTNRTAIDMMGDDINLNNMNSVDHVNNNGNISRDEEDIYDLKKDLSFADVYSEKQQQQLQQLMDKDDAKPTEVDESEVGCCRTLWHYLTFNRGRNITTFTILGALANSMAYSVGSYINSQVSSLERQFGLSSAEFGFINSSNDIGFVLVVLLASHLGRDAHIPKVFSSLTLIVAFVISSLSLTYLLRPIDHLQLISKYEDGNNTNATANFSLGEVNTSTTDLYLCLSNDSKIIEDANCSSNYVKSHSAYFMFVILLVILGACKGPRSSLFPIYIDNNVPKKHHTSIFIGLLIVIAILGNGCIFIVGGVISRIPVDLIGKNMSPMDPNWIGAWWIGFIIIGTATIVFAFPLFFYPRKMPEDKKYSTKSSTLDSALNEFVHQNAESKDIVKMSVKEKLKELPSSLKGLVTNPVFILLVIGDCVFAFCFNGLWSFAPKYLEHQFYLPIWQTNYILAMIGLVASVVGILFGCTIITRLKLEVGGMLKMKFIAAIGCLALEVILTFLKCETPNIINNPMSDSSIQANGTLITDCNCNINQYLPICGSDGNNYFSPCHAGCGAGNYFSFTNCSVIAGGTAMLGMCPVNCSARYVFVGIILVVNLIAMSCIPATYLVVIRTPDEKDKTLGVGFFSMFLALGAFLPGPVVFGRIIDSVCVLWDYKCGHRGACRMYNLGNLRRAIFFPMLFGRSFSLITLSLALYIFIRKLKKMNAANKTDKSVQM
ncbi:solute carrier organic anion transporter family member 2A1-like [Argonauta hians]